MIGSFPKHVRKGSSVIIKETDNKEVKGEFFDVDYETEEVKIKVSSHDIKAYRLENYGSCWTMDVNYDSKLDREIL